MPKWMVAFGLGATAVAVASTGPVAFAAPEKTMSDKKVAELFASTCGFCHENGGRVAGKGPQLAGTARSDAFIINRIKEGKEGAMPAFDGALSNGQIKGILHYIRNLKSE